MSERSNWDEYFMTLAKHIATRATCDRKHVGAVIVRDKIILSTGYNGSIKGAVHCDDVGHMMDEGHCLRTVHAEANAIAQAAKFGHALDGATLYSSASPCWYCFKLLVNSGIKEMVFGEFYRDRRSFEAAETLGITLRTIKEQNESTNEPTQGCLF